MENNVNLHHLYRETQNSEHVTWKRKVVLFVRNATEYITGFAIKKGKQTLSFTCEHFFARCHTNNSNHQVSAAQRTATLQPLSHLNNEQDNNKNIFSFFFFFLSVQEFKQYYSSRSQRSANSLSAGFR